MPELSVNSVFLIFFFISKSLKTNAIIANTNGKNRYYRVFNPESQLGIVKFVLKGSKQESTRKNSEFIDKALLDKAIPPCFLEVEANFTSY